MRRHVQISAGLFGALVLLVALVGGIRANSDQPPAIPERAQAARIVSINTAAITQDTNFSGVIWGINDEADLVYRVTAGTANTMSLELEVSPDNTYWYDSVLSPTIVSGITATVNGYVSDIPVSLYYFRIVANVTNANAVTPVIKMVLRP